MNRRELRYFEKARQVSLRSMHQCARIGAVIVDGNYIVATGYNVEKSHPMQAAYNRKTKYYKCNDKMHAEMSALVNSKRYDLSGTDVFIFREDFNGNLAMCRPCSACSAALYDAGVRNIYYTSDTGMHFEKWMKNPFNGQKTGWVKSTRKTNGQKS